VYLYLTAKTILQMLTLSKPYDHDRLNACVFDQLNMKINGDVCIPGEWDCYDTLGYLEQRLKKSVIATFEDDGSVFTVCGKIVFFKDDMVLIKNEEKTY
jgi:hypothetical protein